MANKKAFPNKKAESMVFPDRRLEMENPTRIGMAMMANRMEFSRLNRSSQSLARGEARRLNPSKRRSNLLKISVLSLGLVMGLKRLSISKPCFPGGCLRLFKNGYRPLGKNLDGYFPYKTWQPDIDLPVIRIYDLNHHK